MRVHPVASAALFVMLLSVLSAQTVDADKGAELLRSRVSKFVVHQGTIFEGVAKLSSEQEGLALAFEDILRTKISDAAASDVRFDLQLENQTFSNILDALCQADPRFTWSNSSTVINVYPRSTIGDDSYLLNRRLSDTELKNITDAEQAVFGVIAHLPPPFEQIALAQAGGDTSYGSPWNPHFHDTNVREAFNLIAQRLGPRAGWVFNGSKEFRTLGFHNREIHYSSSGSINGDAK